MPTFRNVIAGLAISTALTGGVVCLSAATGASAANAASMCSSCGHGDGWRRCNRAYKRYYERKYRRTVQAALVGVRNRCSSGDTIVDIDFDD
ncbi:hypothetical protein JOL79_27980 [Microbispora sp. RL4-1S]|uniref:Uncharacterized protein n=1 Tax=Microbispora oryzae TaxID=2806554 RepID=A0A940WPJ7_9ACTN|nr:hypothetical protein [Microbispora oryzae]MBP2707627.1 hypothetical protein [Microbispora oryzae]